MNEYWRPAPLFAGETAFILGGGPSLRGMDLAALRGRKVITVTSSCFLAARAGLDDGVLFWMDASWWDSHRKPCASWRGQLVTVCAKAKKDDPDRVLLVRDEKRETFPPAGADCIRKGRTSGHGSISLAIAMGARRVVLLGFDMRLVGKRSHHHDDYPRRAQPAVYLNFLRAFAGWNTAARAVGVEIVNCTPGSAITEFATMELAEVLA